MLFKISFFVSLLIFASSICAKLIPEGRSDLLSMALLQAKPNEHIQLAGGKYQGHFTITTPLTLESQNPKKPAVLTANQQGSVLTIQAPNTQIRHLRFEDSGIDMSARDSCLFIDEAAKDALIIHNRFERCGFSIWVHATPHVQIRDNTILGLSKGPVSDRGNGVYLIHTLGAVISDNVISNGRDGIYILASKDAMIKHNHFINTRFGVHYMYNNNCTIVDNFTEKSSVGAAMMYSKNLKINNNTFLNNRHHGLLLRDILNSDVINNVSMHNVDGLFLGSSYFNHIRHNQFSHNALGVIVTGASDDNQVFLNNFIDNDLQAKFLGVKSLVWSAKGQGNFWSTYRGWDTDKDGIGDQIYYVTNLSNWLTFSYPVLRVILDSPAMVLLQRIETQFPVLRKSAIIDAKPQMRPVP